MVSKKYIILLAMLVLAIFAVGSVSATDDVTVDIDVPTDGIAVDDVSVEEVVESNDASSDAEVDDNSENLRTSPYYVNNSMTLSEIQTIIDEAESGSTIYFTEGQYNQTTLTLKSNLNVFGLNAVLVGDGVNNVINLPDNCTNIVISGFAIDANYISSDHNISAIRGSFITNAQITNNIIYNGFNGINLNKYCANIQVTDNSIYNMINDGVSFANPITFSTISSVGYSYISRNNISNCGFGIFIGGNFQGEIANDKISNCTVGIEFAGKPEPGNGTLRTIVSYMNITGCINGINMYHPYAMYLSLNQVNFAEITEYDVNTNETVNSAGYISVSYSTFCQGVTQDFDDAVDTEFGNTNYHVKTQ